MLRRSQLLLCISHDMRIKLCMFYVIILHKNNEAEEIFHLSKII